MVFSGLPKSVVVVILIICQDALTDLTGDSERLPVEEQHGTWLGHKVREDSF